MSDVSSAKLVTALRTGKVAGDPCISAVVRRIGGALDSLRFTHAGIGPDGTPLRRPYTECQPEQIVRAARIAEYELHDAVRRALSNGNSKKRYDQLREEQKVLLRLMPERLSDIELEDLLARLFHEANANQDLDTPSQAKAHVLHKLREQYFGRYDGRAARQITEALVESLFATTPGY